MRASGGFLSASWSRGLVLALVLASPAVTTRLTPNTYRGGYSRDISNVQQRNSSAIAAIMGEFRTSMADMIFIKTERYLHNGIAYGLHLDLEASTQKGSLVSVKKEPKAKDEHEGHHDHEGHDHDEHGHGEPGHVHGPDCEHGPDPDAGAMAMSGEGGEDLEHSDDDHGDEHTPTLIRTAENDFRSFIGDLERAVKPWQSPEIAHQHTEGTELLPWYRIVTLTDPTNVRGYMIGSWWLSRQRTNESIEEAISFAREGIRNNPDAYQLHLMVGNHLRALNRGRESREAYRQAATLALKQRPRDIAANPWWTHYMEEDARAAARLAVMSEKEWGSLPEAVMLARTLIAEFEDGDGVLRRQIDEMTSAGMALDTREP